MEDLKPYPKYKTTKLNWLNQVPIDWDIKRTAALFHEKKTLNKEYQFKQAFQFKFGEIVNKKQIGTQEELKETYQKYTIVDKDDIVINGLNLNYDFLTQRVGKVRESGIITSTYISISPQKEEIEPRYACYLLKTLDNRKMLNGMGTGIRLTLSFPELKKQYLPLPPLSEQIQMANYLDYKVALINKFIKDKKKEIILLKEQKQAEINQAVTRGVNPNAKMKDSGISWIGEIPEHWEIMHLRGLLKMTSVKNMAHLPLLSVVREKGVIVRDLVNDKNHNFVPDDLSGYKAVKKGDFVINKMKAWQGSCGVSKFDGIVSPAYYTFELDFENKDYFNLAIRSKIYVNFFTQFSGGIRVGQWDLSAQKLKSISFFVPPAKEQIEIEEYLQTKTEQINRAISAIENEIALLQDYKISTISDVVTGKVDVRNIAVENIEDEPEEDVEEMEDTEEIENSEE